MADTDSLERIRKALEACKAASDPNIPAAAALSCACVDPMCACRGGPCAECPEGQAIAAASVAQPPATAEAKWEEFDAWYSDVFMRKQGCTPSDVSLQAGSMYEAYWAGRSALATQPPAPVQQTEAVAWQVRHSKAVPWGPATTKRIADHWEAHGYEVRTLYATPPAPALPPVARVPLTRERILALWGDRSDGPPTHQIISFARAVEASTGEQSHG